VEKKNWVTAWRREVGGDGGNGPREWGRAKKKSTPGPKMIHTTVAAGASARGKTRKVHPPGKTRLTLKSGRPVKPAKAARQHGRPLG